MRLFSAACVFAIVSPALADPPPYSSTYSIDGLDAVGDLQWPSINRPFWFRFTHQNSAYFNVGAAGYMRGSTIMSSVIATYDPDGTLLDTLTITTQNAAIRYGTLWHPGDVGSPIMFAPNQYYYVGFAPGGTVFHDNFQADFVDGQGRQRYFFSPSPGTATVIGLFAVRAVRRRRREA